MAVTNSSFPSVARLRVLLVSGPASGGLKRHVETLAQRLPEHGIEVALAVPPGADYAAETRYPFPLSDRPDPVAMARSVAQLRRAILTFRPHLVHAHGAKAALAASWVAGGPRCPLAITFHNVWHGGFLTVPLRCATRASEAQIAVSQAVRVSLERFGICETSTIIPNGIDLAHYTPGLASGEGPFTVAFVGRLTEEKGLPVLLRAVTALAHRPDIRFVIAGEGPLRAEIEAAVPVSGGLLTYLGRLDDVRPVYHQARVVVMPSLSEGLPLTALEAMASGLPVVASQVGGLPEVVLPGETGLLVPPGDADALKQALLQLADGREQGITLGAAGRRRVEAEFSEARMLEALLHVYQQLLKGRKW